MTKKQIFMIKIVGDKNGRDAHATRQYKMDAEFATNSIRWAREKLDELEIKLQKKIEEQSGKETEN